MGEGGKANNNLLQNLKFEFVLQAKLCDTVAYPGIVKDLHNQRQLEITIYDWNPFGLYTVYTLLSKICFLFSICNIKYSILM